MPDKDKIAKVSVEDIQDTYRQGYITAKDRNNYLIQKAHVTLDQLIDEKGYLGAVMSKTIQNLQEGWDNLKASAMREPAGIPKSGADVKNELYYTGLAIWGQVQMLTSAINAAGSVTGQEAERLALKAGASPGLARVINFAVDVGTGFVPIGLGARGLAKGVQKLAGGTRPDRAAKALQAAKEAAAAEPVKVVEAALSDGLKVDGVKDVGAIVSEGANPEGIKLIQQAQEQIAAAASPSVAEQFSAGLKAAKETLAKYTAPQTHEMTQRMADKLGYTLEDLQAAVPGKLDAAEMLSYLNAMDGPVKTAVDLAKKVIANPTEEATNTFARHMLDLFTYTPQFRGSEAVAGRTVEILNREPRIKQLTNMLLGWDPEHMASGNFTGAIQTMAEDIAAMGEKPEALKPLVVGAQSGWQKFKENYWPMAREAYINLLMARPITQVRNFLGNSIASANGVMERFAGGVFSADEKKGLVASEGYYLAKGMTMALADASKQFFKAFQKMSPEEVTKFDFIPGQIPGTLGRIIRGPGDAARGMDNFFKEITRRGSYYATAIRDAVQRGLGGEDLAEFVARRVANPTERMLAEGRDFSLTQTFQNELGTFGRRIQQTLQTGPLALYFPFMKTPMNLAKYAWNRTPGLQFLSKSLYDDILEGGTRADSAIGRLTISNMLGMFLYDLAKEGFITGNGPVEPSLRRAWLATNEPYSVRTKAGWWPISNAEPGSTLVGMMGDYASVRNQLDEETAGQTAMAIGFSIMHNLADKTYWQTVSDLVDAVSGMSQGTGPNKQMRDVLLGPIETTATLGPLGAGVARAMDPVRRETRSFLDNVIARVPGYSQTEPPVRDAYGDPKLLPQAVGSAWLGLVSPISYKEGTQDRIKLEGEKLQIKTPAFPWTFGGNVRDDFDIRAPLPEDRLGVELTPQQRDRWQQIYRNLLRHPELGIEKNILENPTYQNSPRALQREMFMDFMAEARANAREALTVEDKSLGQKLIQSEITAVQPKLTPQQRMQFQPQFERATGLFDTISRRERNNLLRWGILDYEPQVTGEAPPPPMETGSAPAPAPITVPPSAPTRGVTTKAAPVIGR